PISCFRLIEELPSLSIVVEQDEQASAAIRELRHALAIEDPHRRRTAVRQAFRALEFYTVTPLLLRALRNLPPPLIYGREDLRLVSREALASFYDEQTGFRWELNQFQ
ncbi:MAG: CRISPR-associated endonuclease Cas3'', partial [Dehalococcoidia bacterium]|nr:CRISPR-associated endonuclease Cas3'' [Dehalococcoidia bacterium]